MSIAQLARGRVPGGIRRAAKRDPLVAISLGFLILVIAAAIFGPLVAPYDPAALFTGNALQPASPSHWFGTDDLGRDIFSRALHGARASVLAPALIVLVSTGFGVGIAIVAAWFGGIIRGVTARIIDVIFAIPGLVLAIMAVAMFGKGVTAPVIALSIAYLPVVVRLTQTTASRELGAPYIAALRLQGVSSIGICVRHLIPALMPVVAAQAAVGFGYAMLDLAGISFLGLGQQPPATDWGSMIADGQASILSGAPEQSIYASVLIVLTVLAVSIVGARVTVWAEAKDQ